MMEKSHPLSENVYSLIHELLVPLKTIVGAHSILITNVPYIPQPIEEPLVRLGQISNKLHTEIMTLFRDPSKRVNLQSAEIASEQIRLIASEWGNDGKKLSQLVSQIKAANVHLEEESLNTILNEVLANGLEKFNRIVSYLEITQAKHLTLNNGFFDVLQVKREDT